MYDEDDLLPLSGLQHLSFCARQWGLIYLEGMWAENRLTVEGKHLHERADASGVEVRGDLRIVRGLRIQSRRLGLAGIADVVEFRRLADATVAGSATAALCQLNIPPGQDITPTDGVSLPSVPGRWLPMPVEYKHGRPKAGRCDEVQLCAQALCLEEMLGVKITEAALYYGQTRRRHVVALDAALRAETEALAARMHVLERSGKTPPPEPGPKCRNCSLVELCKPESIASKGRASSYVARLFESLERGYEA